MTQYVCEGGTNEEERKDLVDGGGLVALNEEGEKSEEMDVETEREGWRSGGREGRRSCRLERQRLRFRPEMSDESEAFWEVASIGLLRLRRSATGAGKFTTTPSAR